MSSEHGTWTPGRVVADIYEVVREIGRGGMGVVYLLKERGTGRAAAAKVPTGEFIANERLRKRFTREAQVWTELAAHPNIVRAYDVREVDYRPCIFMEYAEDSGKGEVPGRGGFIRPPSLGIHALRYDCDDVEGL